jgi:hypothetical protein
MSRTRPSQGLPVKRLPRAPTLSPRVLSMPPSHCVRMTMIKHRVCGILTRTRQHEDRVNLLSILNASVHTISLTMFALPRHDMRHPLTLWHRTFISNAQVIAGRSSIDVRNVFVDLPNDYNSDISTDAAATSSSTRGRTTVKRF